MEVGGNIHDPVPCANVKYIISIARLQAAGCIGSGVLDTTAYVQNHYLHVLLKLVNFDITKQCLCSCVGKCLSPLLNTKLVQERHEIRVQWFPLESRRDVLGSAMLSSTPSSNMLQIMTKLVNQRHPLC